MRRKKVNQKLFNKMLERLSSSGPKAFPWSIIIDAILALIEGCLERPASGAALKSAPLTRDSDNERWVRFSVAKALRESGVRATRANVDAVMSALVKARAEASDEELQEVLDCCFSWDI